MNNGNISTKYVFINRNRKDQDKHFSAIQPKALELTIHITRISKKPVSYIIYGFDESYDDISILVMTIKKRVSFA